MRAAQGLLGCGSWCQGPALQARGPCLHEVEGGSCLSPRSIWWPWPSTAGNSELAWHRRLRRPLGSPVGRRGGSASCKVARGVLPSPGMGGPQCWPHGDGPACRGVTPSHAAPARLHHLEHSAAPVACPRGGGQACPHTGAAAQGGLWGEQGPRTPSSRLLRPPGVKGPGAHCVFRGGQSPVLAITGAPIRRDPPTSAPAAVGGSCTLRSARPREPAREEPGPALTQGQ